jgi:hypothetical protein
MSTITPQGGEATPETRKVVGGWHAIQQGNKESRQQRILREQREKSSAPKTENGYRPGDDEPNGEFNMRRLKESAQRMVQQTQAKREFKGSPDQVLAKLEVLFNGSEDPETGVKKSPAKKPEILSVEQSGFGVYKISYLI